MWDCKEYMYRQRPYVDKICELLKRIGPAESRRHLFEKYNCQGTQTSRPPSRCSTTVDEPDGQPSKIEDIIFKTASSGEDDSESNDETASPAPQTNLTAKSAKRDESPELTPREDGKRV